MSKEERIVFQALGLEVCYEINGTGTHEQLWFGKNLLIDASGEVGCYKDEAWQMSLLLRGAARRAVWDKLLREHAESLLASELLGIRDLYKQLNEV